MHVSRIDKLLNARTVEPSLERSRQSRSVPLAIVLHDLEPVKRAVMAHVATTLALRCFTGPIYVYGDRRVLGVESQPGTLGDQLLDSAAAFGETARIQWRDGSPSGQPTLHIGGGAEAGFVANAAGWVAGVNTWLPGGLPAEVPASVFAVSCVFAQVFNRTLLGGGRAHSWTFSVSDLAAGVDAPSAYTLASVECGQVGVLGAGAIGSAFAYALWLSDWTASLDILDGDHYDEPNLETTCLIGKEEVMRCRPKAAALAEASTRSGLRTSGRHVVVERGSPELDIPRSTFVCAVDNPETRRILDSTRASLLLNGAVGGAAHDAGLVLFTRHGATDPPLAERYPERSVGPAEQASHIPVEIPDDCSRVAYDGIATAAPFIATATAAMLAAACARAPPPDAPNYLKLDLFGRQDRIDRRLLRRTT